MIFSSFTFLLLFMPGVLLLYRVLPSRVRMPFLLAASLLFYGWGNPAWLLLIFFSMVLNWGGVLLMTRGGKNRSGVAADRAPKPRVSAPEKDEWSPAESVRSGVADL